MKKIKQIILLMYLLWFATFFLKAAGFESLPVFFYIVFFQFFIPGLVLGLSLGLSKRPLTEIIFFSFILSYLIYFIAALPTLFIQISWPLFSGLNIFLCILALIIFLIKIRSGLILTCPKIRANEIFVIIFGLLVLFTYSYINFRSDATEFNNRIVSSLQSESVETNHLSNWMLDDDGTLTKKPVKSFFSDYKTYFNFLALPLKYSSIQQKDGWFIFNKIFIFLSIIGIYCLGRKLRGDIGGVLSLLFFIFTVFVFGFYYGENNIAASGALFEHAAYGRFVAESVFLIAFYLAVIEAFKSQRRQDFLFAGLILLGVFSIHYYAFCWAAFNFFLFSVIFFLTNASRQTKKVLCGLRDFFKNNIYVGIFVVVLLVCLFFFTNYVNDAFHLADTIESSQPGRFDSINKVTLVGQIKMLWDKENILFILSIIIGAPWCLARIIRKRDVESQFIFSNIILYLIAMTPLVSNALLTNKLKSFTERLDGSLLFYVIIAFLIACSAERFKLKGTLLIWAAAVSTLIIFLIFGTDNSFATELRYRKNAGYNFLKMTEYFKSLKRPADNSEGFTVLTNIKTAVDIFAYFNAYVFQYNSKLLGTPAITAGRKDIEHLLFYPYDENGKLIELIAQKRVDYIIVPTERTSYVSAENAANFNQAVAFYDSLKQYQLIYQDSYYYIYHKDR